MLPANTQYLYRDFYIGTTYLKCYLQILSTFIPATTYNLPKILPTHTQYLYTCYYIQPSKILPTLNYNLYTGYHLGTTPPIVTVRKSIYVSFLPTTKFEPGFELTPSCGIEPRIECSSTCCKKIGKRPLLKFFSFRKQTLSILLYRLLNNRFYR